MDYITIANNLTSFAVVMTTWWLAHLTGTREGHYRKTISVCYMIIGLISAAFILFRTTSLDTIWLQLCYKLALITLFSFIIMRLGHRNVR